jgi:ribosome-binding protein aMBF1 (putative translation factor)
MWNSSKGKTRRAMQTIIVSIVNYMTISLGQTLKLVRRNRYMSRSEMAEKLAITASFLLEIEEGKNEPSSNQIKAWSFLLSCNLISLTD